MFVASIIAFMWILLSVSFVTCFSLWDRRMKAYDAASTLPKEPILTFGQRHQLGHFRDKA